jgi:hypothetical protein
MSARSAGIHYTEQLLDCVMHYLPQDVRAKVMHEVPQAYNAYCEREIVVTIVEPIHA